MANNDDIVTPNEFRNILGLFSPLVYTDEYLVSTEEEDENLCKMLEQGASKIHDYEIVAVTNNRLKMHGKRPMRWVHLWKERLKRGKR